HGTVATVSDPHEIGNVLGVAGVDFMIENARQTPLKCCFGAPSCVPATTFETAGAVIDAEAVRQLLERPEIGYLSEMMNYPGVLHADPEVLQKIAHARALGKPVDGHAPGLRGDDARRYMAAGISTDHECFTYDEALDKLRLGMKVLIREGSAAKNFEALIGLLPQYNAQLMFCSDDKHPDDLLMGHINELVARAVAKGYDLYDVLRVACLHPVEHYRLPVGLLRPGDPADFIVVDDLREFRPTATYIDGRLVAENGRSLLAPVPFDRPNHFAVTPKTAADFALPATSDRIRVIEALDGQLITHSQIAEAVVVDGSLAADPARDLLKIAVVNRYADRQPAVAFIRGFGLQRGAIASSVGHDSHNILAVGADDEALCRAVNLLIEHRGGVCAVDGEREEILPLPVAGLMSDLDGWAVAESYQRIDRMAKELGSTLKAPFMTLSFMALLVIPSLKLSDLGLFDGERFEFVELGFGR
ncbi:MAG: adenine deaminase, partial [Saprospiraceae bacterium]|nr:adenine deaminase [Saprospiraceae bacterium]